MVKVKGYRIEIGEVENAISQLAGIDEFAVVASPDINYGNRLHCFFTVMHGHNISAEQLKNFLATKLPEYMIPYGLHKSSQLPKTSSGKVDRVRLSEMAAAV